MDHPTTKTDVDNKLQDAARVALELAEDNEFSLRVAATHASRRRNMTRQQQEIYHRAKTLQ